METKKAKVAMVVENQRSYNTQNGTCYVHRITFTNGDSGDYNSKSPKCEKFKQGVETEYTIETKVNGQYTNVLIKPVSTQSATGGGFKAQPKDEGKIVAQSCLNYATQFYQQRNATTAEVFSLAQEMFNWVNAKSSK
jgi:hypothetical protein